MRLGYEPSPAPKRFRVGALQIDLERSAVSGHGSPSDLTPRAEALLLCLARSANQVVSREEILGTVWAGRIVEDAVISKCVWEIRKVLGEDGKAILQNRAKRGYVLVVPADAWLAEETDASGAPTDAAEPPSNGAAALEPDTQAETPETAASEHRTEPAEPPAPAAAVRRVAGSARTPAAGADSEQSRSEQVRSEQARSEQTDPASARQDAVASGRSAQPGAARNGDARNLAAPSASAPAAAEPASATSRWRSMWARRPVRWAAAVLACALIAVGAWRWSAAGYGGAGTLEISPEAEMTVAVETPANLDWLRSAVLAVAAEAAYLRDGKVLWFEAPQKRNPFAGPHLQVRVEAADAGGIAAEWFLEAPGQRWRGAYDGPAKDFNKTLKAFLDERLPAARRVASPATDLFLAGMVADLQRDRLAAINEYRRALARDPALVDARLAMGAALIELGRSREALELLQRFDAQEMSAPQRCAQSELIATIAPQQLKGDECEKAARVTDARQRNSKELLREIDADRDIGASQWLNNERAAIEAHLNLQQFDEAQDRIEQAQRTAADAGWMSARAELGIYRGRLAIHRGRIADSIKAYRSIAAELDKYRLANAGFETQIMLMRMQRPIPGPMVIEQRAAMQAMVERARRIGSVRGEVDALHMLARLDRDDIAVWQSHLDRIKTLIGASYTPQRQIVQEQQMLNEMLGQRRYGAVIEGVNRLQRGGATDTAAQNWNLTLKAEAAFPNDRFDIAIDAIDAMEKENFDIRETSPCLFAWLFVEADLPERAAQMLQKCPYKDHDRVARAAWGDHGLLAVARLSQRQDPPGRAWEVLRPRIDELLAFPDLNRQEAESLALLARHAAGMPGADPERLREVLRVTSEMITRNGPGPGLRFGVHTLRWRLCMADGGSDCGPPLPDWATEDRLEARFAEDYAAGLKAQRSRAIPQ